MRVEREVLVPLHGAAVLGRLHVQLAAVVPDLRPDQRLCNVQQPLVPGQAVEHVVYGDGALDAAHPRRFRGVTRLQIIHLRMLRGAPGLLHQVVHHGPGMRHLCFREDGFHRQKPVFTVPDDLLLGKHTRPSDASGPLQTAPG